MTFDCLDDIFFLYVCENCYFFFFGEDVSQFPYAERHDSLTPDLFEMQLIDVQVSYTVNPWSIQEITPSLLENLWVMEMWDKDFTI